MYMASPLTVLTIPLKNIKSFLEAEEARKLA